MDETLARLALLEVRLRKAEIKEAVRLVTAKRVFRKRRARTRELTPEVLTAFAEAFLDEHGSRTAGVRDIARRLTKLVKLFKRAPKLLDRIKEFVGELTPSNLIAWARKGFAKARRAVLKAVQSWPLAMFFFPKSKLPSLSDILTKILEGTRVGEMLKRIGKKAVRVDEWLEKHPIIRGLSRPVLAALFIWIWLNVAEISWDMESIFRGFTGQLPFSEVLSSLPESAIGLIFASFGVGYHFMGPVLLARILWLVASNYIEYVPGKGFKVYWDLMGRYTPESGTIWDRTPDVQFIRWSPT